MDYDCYAKCGVVSKIVLAPSHHQLPLHHPKIPLGILNPIIAKDVQLDLSNITPCLH